MCGVQLGIGKMNSSSHPIAIPVSNRSPLIRVCAGGEHSLFVTDDGRVYGCGLSTEGQLGPAQDHNPGDDAFSQSSRASNSRLVDQLVLDPTRLRCLGEFRIIQVAAGKHHSVALTEAGEPLAFGSNEFGQLGRRPDNTADNAVPVRVSGLGGIRIVQVCAVAVA